MKALTLWEPWGTLMALEAKKVETRCWKTLYRGPVAIHTAKTIPGWLGESRNSEEFHHRMSKILEDRKSSLVKGSILCIADLVSVEQTEMVRADLPEQELLFGNYEDGRYAWFFDNVRRFKTPIPTKGNRMLWNWTPPVSIEMADGSVFRHAGVAYA